MKNSTFWMATSGILGLAFFLIANSTNIFVGSSRIAALIQLVINAFVFIVWTKAFVHSVGLKKFIAFFGIVVPIAMATITICRVLL